MSKTRTRTALLSALTAATLLAPSGPAAAVELTEDGNVRLDLELRPRFFRDDGKDGTVDNDAREIFDMRTRLTFSVRDISGVGGVVQLQDVRIWGEETNTLTDFSADGFDLHQGYLDLNIASQEVSGHRFTLRIGRQEIPLDNQRIVGAVGFSQQGRSFDAIRAIWDGPLGLSADVSLSVISEDETPTNDDTAFLLATALRKALIVEGPDRADLALYAFVDTAEAADRTRYTLGLRHLGAFGALRYQLEGYYQGGSQGDATFSAWMAGGFVGAKFADLNDLTLLLWVDALSGDDDVTDGDVKTFDTLFATNHGLYGMADFFTNIPANTGGRGLLDVALKAEIKATAALKLLLHYHYFSGLDVPEGGTATFGHEVDFVAEYQLNPFASIFLGVFTMLPQDGLVEAQGLAGTDADVGVYTYVHVKL